MTAMKLLFSGFSIATSSLVAAASFAVPGATPSNAAVLEASPLGISFEFFTFPSYMTNVTTTRQCLLNFKALTGAWPPIRIGGTTQDRAKYDASTSAYVVYSVPSSTAAPSTLTFGPSFMTLAGTYEGTVVLGLNRGKNDLANTIAAAKVAKSRMSTLFAIELGNEPEAYPGASQPVATSNWGPAADAASENNWSISVGEAISTKNIIQAGTFYKHPPTWGAAELIASENATARSYVKVHAQHNYPNQDTPTLMSHKSVVSNIGIFANDIAAAKSIGRDWVWGETNSHSGGGTATISPTFGAALWTMDYTLHSVVAGIPRSYFHHGTIGACNYCFWGRHTIGAPYYGAYMAVAAMAGGSRIAALDSGSTNYAAYAIYDDAKSPIKVVLYNSDYYSGSGTRSSQVFTLTGLLANGNGTISAIRLTAPNALSTATAGKSLNIGGQTFQSETCNILGTSTRETASVKKGSASFTLLASEALLVYLS